MSKELEGFYSSLYKRDNLKSSEDVLNWFLRTQVIPKFFRRRSFMWGQIDSYGML